MKLVDQFENMLRTIKPDMTIFYQLLIDLPSHLNNEQDVVKHFEESFYKEPGEADRQTLNASIKAYLERLKSNTCCREESIKRMRENNPRFILRNYLLHQAIEDLQDGNDNLFVKLQEAMKEPYSNKYDEIFVKRPSWAAQKAGCSMLSCSS